MKQIVIQPGFLEHTTIHLIELDGLEVSRKRIIHMKGMDVNEIVGVLRGYDSRIPIFIDPGYPQLRDELKMRGYWVLR